MNRESQRNRILHLLQSRATVALPELLELRIANYRARISELREDGYDIVCHKETVDGQVRSKYELRGQKELFEGAA